MNRESKRDTESQPPDQPLDGDSPSDGEVEATTSRATSHEAAPAKPTADKPRGRTGARTFLREVRGELKRVAWPSAREVRSYGIVVLVTVTLLTLYVFALDWGFGRIVFQIFG